MGARGVGRDQGSSHVSMKPNWPSSTGQNASPRAGTPGPLRHSDRRHAPTAAVFEAASENTMDPWAGVGFAEGAGLQVVPTRGKEYVTRAGEAENALKRNAQAGDVMRVTFGLRLERASQPG
jgi:hypothetical protein